MDHGDTEVSEDVSSDDAEEQKEKKKREKEPPSKEKERDKEKDKDSGREPKDKDKEKPPPKEKRESGSKKEREQFEPGEVICVYEDSTKKGKWYPAIVVAAKAYKENALKPRSLSRKEIPIRSFQNGKYLAIPSNQLTKFEAQSVNKKHLEALSNSQRIAIERAQAYIDHRTLPSSWDSKDVHGETSKKKEKPEKKDKDKDTVEKDKEEKAERKEKEQKKEEKEKKPREEKKKAVKKEERDDVERPEKKEREKKEDKAREKDRDTEDKDRVGKEEKERDKDKDKTDGSSSSESDWSDEEYGEERDHFVAQLYKFQDERGTPINRAPILGGKDIDLYKLYRVVQHYGGGKKVTQNQQWKKVLVRMGLEGCSGATPVTVKKAYARYLSHFTNLYKTLFWTLDNTSTQPGASTSRGDRRLFRSIVDKDVKGGSLSKRRKSFAGEKEGNGKDGKEQKEGSKEKEKLGSIKKEKSIDEDGKSVELTSDDQYELPYPVAVSSGPLELSTIKNTIDKDIKRESASPAVSLASSERSKKTDKGAEEKAVPPKEELSLLEKKKIKKKKEGEASDGDEVKKKREKKRLSMRDRSERKSASGMDDGSKDQNDEGYNPADIISHFYMGQKVRAHHHGKWYDARVLEVKQLDSKELLKVLQKGSINTAELGPEVLKELLKHMGETRCFVHYLGWNARYDEWIPLNKIRISIKDTVNSLELVRKARGEAAIKEGKPAISEERLQWVQEWCKSPEGVESLKSNDVPPQPSSFSSMTQNYRPRKVSSSTWEQISTEQLRREKDKSSQSGSSAVSTSSAGPIGSPASSTKSPPPVSVLQPTTTAPSVPLSLPIGSPKSVLPASSPPISSGPLTIDSLLPEQGQISGPPSGRSKKDSAPSTILPSAGPLIIPSDKLSPKQGSVGSGSEPGKNYSESVFNIVGQELSIPERSPPHSSKLVKSEAESSSGISAQAQGKELKRVRAFSKEDITVSSPSSPQVKIKFKKIKNRNNFQKPSTRALSTFSTDTIPAYANESELDFRDDEHERKPSIASIPPMISSLVINEPEKRPETTPTPEKRAIAGKRELKALVGSDKDKVPTTLKKRKRKESVSAEDEPQAKNEKAEEKSPEIEDEKQIEPEYDLPDSALDTPKTAENDNESDRVSLASEAGPSSMRTPRGKLSMKRKRGMHSRHSQMVVDKKYIKKEKRGVQPTHDKDDESDEDEEEGGITVCRDTYLSMKNRMHRVLDQENRLKDVSILGIEDLATLMNRTPAEQLVEALEARLSDLRDIHYHAKTDFLKMERKRKAHAEKKREKEKVQRDSTLTPATSIEK
ncbi:hypothetical protein WR25_26750 isoform C [Diploscapter pachys]|uniref:ARID domain-containing protein n=1 Tax=Diploscapter pachys TaxID=2018661 RepID=A0A2A2JML0_9BILA|nr:hypothetical protein WR25_26750 isoform A [Diploscapter pachys]PAV62913.1 hypothetical protein WR25_26750 isoform B [Diploscapter pachys]PAV62914.1 hypothetical protein WR25_26750 isoform C [Diploscapter pachys]